MWPQREGETKTVLCLDEANNFSEKFFQFFSNLHLLIGTKTPEVNPHDTILTMYSEL